MMFTANSIHPPAQLKSRRRLPARILRSWGAVLVALIALTPRAQAIDIQIFYNNMNENPSYDSNGAWLTFMFNAAATYWENYLPDSGTYPVDIFWSSSEFADDGALGRWSFDNVGNNNIYINPYPTWNGNPTDWYIDSTPFDHSEYDFVNQVRTPDGNLGWDYAGGHWLYRDLDSGEQMDWFGGSPPSLMEVGFRGQAVIGSGGDGRYDLLSTVIHELGHELGVNSSGGPWAAEPAWVNGSNVGFEEDPEGGHLAARSSLMCDGCGMVGTRRLPSAIDIMAAADDEGFSNIDLPRKDFAKGGGSFDWNSHANWMGDRVPDSDDWVFLRSGSSVSLSANAGAAQLLIDQGNSLTTGARTLSVGEDTVIRGGLFSNGQLTVSNGGTFNSGNLIVNGRLQMNGSNTNVDLRIDTTAGAEIRGHGVIKAATMVNEGTIRAEGGTLVIEDLVSANFGGFSGNGMLDATAGNLELTALLTSDFNGTAIIGGGHSIHQNLSWTLAPTGELRLQGSANSATLSGEKVFVNGEVNTTGLGTISAPAEFSSTADVNVASGATLRLTGDTTFRGGSYAGSGRLVQTGNATVAEDTLIEVGTYDWDGHVGAAPSTTTITSGKKLTIDAIAIEDAGDGYDGTVNVNGGTLEVKHGLLGNIPWRMQGTMNLNGPIVFGSARVQGSPMIVGDSTFPGFSTAHLNVQGVTAIEAPVVFESGARVDVANNGSLRLANHTTFKGGQHTGDGTVYQVGDAVVQSNTTLAYDRYYMDGSFDGADSTVTINPGVSLIVDAKRISTGEANRFDGTLHVNGGTLDMRTHTIVPAIPPIRLAKPWRMAGTMHLDTIDGHSPAVNGSPLIVGDSDAGATAARLIVAPGTATIDVTHVTVESNAVTEFAIDGVLTGQYGQIDVTGQIALDGTLELPVNANGGTYSDPVLVGDVDSFLLISASAVDGVFADVIYDNALLDPSFTSNGLFRSYQGDGLFRNVAYTSTDVTFHNYRALPGDANGDFVVDGSDFGIWNSNKFTTGTDWTSGDFNGDGATDGADFGIWNAHKYTSANVTLVPEPASLLLIACGLCLLLSRRRA